MSFDTHRDPGDESTPPKVWDLSQVPVGGALRIKTRNSTYEIRKQAGGLTWRIEQTSAKPNGYTLSPNPVIAELAQNYLKPGEILLFARKSPKSGFDIRLTRTSTIQSIEEIK